LGYERKSLQILGGGYNALPPVDKVPITDYLLAQNWRTDAQGRLVSRAGYLSQFSIAGAGIAHSGGTAGGIASPYYIACNSAITSPTSAVYYNGGATPIAAGFDGNRVGFASQNLHMWIMNRGNQGRHSAAAGWETWNISAPPASPTAATAGSSPPASFNVTYTYNLVGNPAYIHSLTIAGVTYSIAENGYSGPQIPLVLSLIAGGDANCSVTYDGTSQNLVIQAVLPNTLIAVSGSDGNAPINLANGTVTSLPNGTYQYYLTFMSADLSIESNPSPVSNVTTVVGQVITVTIAAADAPTDARTGFVNIYRTGGTMGSAYRVASVPSTVGTPATTFDDAMSDLTATNNGQIMAITHDAPPACAGIIGPFLSRLYAWSDAAHKNRLYYTPVNLPQYWATDPEVGDWSDVGADDENIVWCTIHSNLLVIYKERSIWVQIGDPTSGQLEQVYDGFGLVNAFALAAAGQIDYFVGPAGLNVFDMAQVHAISGNVLPLFNQAVTNAGARTPPGSILPGTAFNSTSTSPYAIALGHAMGRLYIAYAEKGSGNYNLLVFDEGPEPERQAFVQPRSGRWFYHRNIAASLGFFGFLFDGIDMVGLTGAAGGAAVGLSLADFRSFLTADPGGLAIESIYQSHYEDCGFPDNDKQHLEIDIDAQLTTGSGANVYVGFNNGTIPPLLIGTLSAGARKTVSFAFQTSLFPLAGDGGYLARNISIIVDVNGTGLTTLHNIYLYYYVEARLCVVASTIPTDLGAGKNKQCKEVQLDIDTTLGSVTGSVVSDLPGNALAVRANLTTGSSGRGNLNFAFPVAEGLLWQVVVVGVSGHEFRLYAVRLLMRVLGIYVQAYESAEGFKWDSMQVDLGDPDVKIIDQIRIELDTDPGTGTVSATVLTDLPGETFVSRGTSPYLLVTQTAATTRHWVTVPLPDQGIYGRSIDIQTTGTVGYRIYTVQCLWRKIGLYLAGSTPSGFNDAMNVLEFDFKSERINMFKRLEIDCYALGTLTVQFLTDQNGGAPAAVVYTTTLTTTGREPVVLPLPPGLRGRLLRIRLTSPAGAFIFAIRVWTRAIDVLANDPRAIWSWQSFPLQESDALPQWTNLLIDETSPLWKWVDMDFTVKDG
jgi:hypothetical protein